MRIPALLIVAACVAAGEAQAQKPYVSIDAPGVLEALERERPGHYAKIVQALSLAQHVSCETLPGILKTRLDIAATQCSAYLLRTSLPPKVHVAFTLDDVTYASNVPQYKLSPARVQRVEPAPRR